MRRYRPSCERPIEQTAPAVYDVRQVPSSGETPSSGPKYALFFISPVQSPFSPLAWSRMNHSGSFQIDLRTLSALELTRPRRDLRLFLDCFTATSQGGHDDGNR